MTTKIKQAFELAYKLQPDVMRKFSPLPQGQEIYWTHLYSVYKLCVYWGYQDENLLLAAILHDSVEDTEYTHEDVLQNFDDTVANIIKLCTKKKDYAGFNTQDQEEYFSQILNYEDKNIRQSALVIKLADRFDNLMGASFFNDKEVLNSYYLETEKYYLPIAIELGKSQDLQNILDYVKQVLSEG